MVLVSVPTLVVACGSSKSDGGGSGGSAGGAGGAQVTGAGGSSAGGAGGSQATGAGGASAGGAGGAPSSSTGSGGDNPTPGGDCAYTDTTSKLNALVEPDCDTGYCLWDGRYLGESYCTIACAGPGAACPAGYECNDDARVAGKHWCARKKPTAPADLGATCTSDYMAECLGPQTVTENFCLDQYSRTCQNGYCVYDGAAKQSYCSTPCRTTTLPCPDGWDCWRNPSGMAGVYDACIKHHDSAELVGLSCYPGTGYDCKSGVACFTTEYLSQPSCGPQGGTCIDDRREGVKVPTMYCSMSCETSACPAGYQCVSLAKGATSGMYCVKAL